MPSNEKRIRYGAYIRSSSDRQDIEKRLLKADESSPSPDSSLQPKDTPKIMKAISPKPGTTTPKPGPTTGGPSSRR